MVFKITLGTYENAKAFVSLCNKYEEEIDYCVGRYTIDAKSIMGVLAAGLRESKVVIHSDNFDVCERFKNSITLMEEGHE